MRQEFVTALVPALGRSARPRFNVFDVMRHGMHEKQLSNVFAWLLNSKGTHGLGDRFVEVFIHQLNALLPETGANFPLGGYTVRQEVPLAAGHSFDIVDIVLDSPTHRVVVENYFTSDGHGHGFDLYTEHSRADGRTGAVVLLCQQEDRSRLSRGWGGAAVLTYASLLQQLMQDLEADRGYQRSNEDALWFIRQMHRRFEEGTAPMSDQGLLDFVLAMCDSNEASRYQAQRVEPAADQFAADVAEQAREQFVASRKMLHRVKAALKGFASGPLRLQLESSLGSGMPSEVKATWAGIYQWTSNLYFPGEAGTRRVSIMFGPTAWFANNSDTDFEPLEAAPDYSRLLLGIDNPRALVPSSVSIEEVLDGLAADDTRLRDEILELLQRTPQAGAPAPDPMGEAESQVAGPEDELQ